ncbi:MFS transporter [Candidatus Saccharibacteria bacterium]|nr:MFS transporter [Candidatus Saccharibacteria bacterium]
MSSNIKKLYVCNLLTGIVFWYAVEKLFMQSIGISPLGIAINAVVFLLITVIFDVPSGVLADKWNRKYTLVLAILSLGLSSFILGTSSTFTQYLIGTAIYGAYIVLSSGTFQAIMYDSLAEIGEEDHYDKHQGRSYGLFLVGIGISSLAGGYIAQDIGLKETYLFSLVPAVINIIVLLTVKEPRFHKETFDNKFWSHIKASTKVITSQPLVFHLALFLTIGGMLRSTQNEFGGLYYIGLSLSAVAMGCVNAGKWIAGAVGQFLAPYVGRKRAFNLLPWFFVAFAIFSLITNASGIIFFLLASMLYSLVSNQAEATAQGLIPSGLRATTISLISFATNVVMIPLSLLFGWVTQQYSVFRAYQIFALVGLLYLIVWFTKGRAKAMTADRSAFAPASVIEPVK